MEACNTNTGRIRSIKMKFIKTNFVKKMIIVLIIIVTFNSVMPSPVNAGILGTIADYAGGILFKPLAVMLASILAAIDVALSGILAGLGGSLEDILDTLNPVNLIGPDSIFSGEVKLLDANIFKQTNWFNGRNVW